jgi:hypothetical protein
MLIPLKALGQSRTEQFGYLHFVNEILTRLEHWEGFLIVDLLLLGLSSGFGSFLGHSECLHQQLYGLIERSRKLNFFDFNDQTNLLRLD